MSTQTAVSPLHRRRPSRWILQWPALRLGRLLCEGMQAYADAVAVPYTMMLGLDRAREPQPRNRNY
jgi:hypothetical protein